MNGQGATSFVTYSPGERPDVEVRVGDHWYEGELRQWRRLADGRWQAGVQWRRAPGAGTYLGQFPQEDVRPGR